MLFCLIFVSCILEIHRLPSYYFQSEAHTKSSRLYLVVQAIYYVDHWYKPTELRHHGGFIANVLVPNTCQATSNYHFDSTMSLPHMNHIVWHRYHVPTIRTLRPRQIDRNFADDVFKCISLNEHVWILLKISPKFVPKFRINNIPVLIQIMAWRQPGDKPLSVPMMVSLLAHICVIWPW